MVNFAQYGTVDYANQVADKLSGFNLPENIAARRNVQIGQQSNEMKLRQMQQQEQERAMALQEREMAKQEWKSAVEEGQATGKNPLEIYQSKRAQTSPESAIAAEEYKRSLRPKKVAFDETTGQVLLETPEGYQRQQVEGWQPKMKIESASNLRKLMEERNQFPQGSPEYAAYTNAIRKESETARQITPQVIMPRQERMVAVIDPETNMPTYIPQSEARGMRPASGSIGAGKPMPTAALKLQNEALDAIGASSSLNADMGAFINMIDEGKLKLGLTENIAGQVRNYLGKSTEESRNLASFKSNLERLRNESLRLNKGVQTEGDAIRAWNEILANINDPELVKQRLLEVQKVNERAAELRKLEVDTIRANFGLEPMDTSRIEKAPSAYGLPKQQSEAQPMATMPPASSATGRIVKDTNTGIRYKSDGSRWVRVQ